MAEAQDAVERQITMLTTLHFVVQTQRSATIAEATGRASMFLTSVSMALVALGFIAQATELSDAFYAFAAALLAILLLIGLSTFVRAVQLGAEDGMFAVASERIREFYASAAPGIERWFALPLQRGGAIGEAAVTVRSRGQLLMTASSMIALVNAALAGVMAALAASRLSNAALAAATTVGAATFVVVWAGQLIVSRRMWRSIEARVGAAQR